MFLSVDDECRGSICSFLVHRLGTNEQPRHKRWWPSLYERSTIVTTEANVTTCGTNCIRHWCQTEQTRRQSFLAFCLYTWISPLPLAVHSFNPPLPLCDSCGQLSGLHEQPSSKPFLFDLHNKEIFCSSAYFHKEISISVRSVFCCSSSTSLSRCFSPLWVTLRFS